MARFSRFRDWELKIRNDRHKPRRMVEVMSELADQWRKIKDEDGREAYISAIEKVEAAELGVRAAQIATNDIRTRNADDRQAVSISIVISRLRYLLGRHDDLLSAYSDLLDQQHHWRGFEASIILTEQLLEHVQGQRDAIRTELLGYGVDVASPVLASSPRGEPQATPGKSAPGRRISGKRGSVTRNRGMESHGEDPPMMKPSRLSRQRAHARTQEGLEGRKTSSPFGAHESFKGRGRGSDGSRKRRGSGEGPASSMRPVQRPRPNTEDRNGNNNGELDPSADLPDNTAELNQDERMPSGGPRDGRNSRPRSASSKSSAGDRPTEEELVEQLAIVDDGPMHDWYIRNRLDADNDPSISLEAVLKVLVVFWREHAHDQEFWAVARDARDIFADRRPEGELGEDGPTSRGRGQTPEVPIPFLGLFGNESDEEFQDHTPVLEGGNGLPPPRPAPPSVPPPGPPQPVWTKSRKAQQLQFGNPFPGSLDQWQWAQSLGEGGQGHAGLWVRYDQDGYVIDRMAVKELWYDNPGDRTHKGIWKDIDLGVRTCLEDDVHKMLSGLESSGSIVRHRAGVLYDQLRMQRIYMEYCALGSLQDLRQRHDTARREAQTAQDEEGMDSAIIPEPFIWSLLETLAEAAHLMYKGTLSSDGPPFNDILHRDIKPANVFLADNLGSGWPGMRAIAKLGDFGGAIERQARDTINPRGMVDFGTPYYMAPEQFGECQNLLPTPLTSRVNVYGIGKTILALMVLTDPPLHNHFGRLPILITIFERSYSQRLWDLIEQCVHGPIGMRPTVEELLEDVRRHIQQNNLRTAGDRNVLLRADAYALLAKPAPRRGDRD
ncbi:hypothetical protein LTR86_007052 [Recurvomyces mirabilis]|nr:hypothetical protein LTR86_007052 [Recurvomyces mirabilis]